MAPPSPSVALSYGCPQYLKSNSSAVRGIAEIESDRAIAPDFISEDATTCPAAMDLVNAVFFSKIKFAPRFDENSAGRFFGQELFQDWALIRSVVNRFVLFDFGIIEAFVLFDACDGQVSPSRGQDADSKSRIESGDRVLS